MANECLAALDAVNAGRLSDGELADLLSELQKERRSRRAAESLDGLEVEMLTKASEIAEDIDLAAMVEKRNALINLVVKQRAKALAGRARDELGDASLGLEALIVGINKRIDGGRMSIDARGKALTQTMLGGMITEIRKAGLYHAWRNRGLDREIARELWDLSLAKPKGDATTSADAKALAAIIHKYRRAAVQRENRAGAFIRMRQGYVTRQSHDRARLRRAGRDAWADEVRARVDWDAMEVPEDEQEAFLTAAFEALTTGERRPQRGGEESDLIRGFTGPGNLGKRASASRVILFKSPDDWFDYNERFGMRALNEALIADFERAARNTALMEGLGTNPEAMFRTLQDELALDARSDPKAVDRLRRKSLANMLDEVTGTALIAYSENLATVGAVTRAWQSMAKLGGVVISSITDIATMAAERRHQGQSIAGMWADAFQATLAGLAGGEERRRYAEALGVGIDGMLGDVAARFSAQDNLPGRMSKLMSVFFKLNLLAPWTDATRRGIGRIIAYDLANTADRPLSELQGEQWGAILRQYGLDEDRWEIARKAIVADGEGRKMLLPGEIQNLDLTEFQGKKLTPTAAQKLKDEIQTSVGSIIIDRVDHASPQPGARTRAIMRQGTRPGTPEGEALRFLMQFKAFPITVVERVMGNMVYGRGAKTMGDAFLRGQGDLIGLASYITGATVLGFMAMQAKEVAKGREPREADAGAVLAAFLQGGGAGIYGDFLLGETNRFGGGLLSSVAGPTLGMLEDADRVRATLLAGEDAGAEALRLVKSNIPFANMFYTKAALDYLVWFQLQETVSPGYLRRMERRMQKENGQRYFLPPSSTRDLSLF